MTILDASADITSPNGWAPLGKIVGVAIHHTVTSISPAASEGQEREHIRAIDRYHVSQGWHGLGYHYLCFPSGRVYRTGWGCRAHVASRNHELIGIAWVADLSSRTPNMYEIAAAAVALRDAWERIGAQVEVRGHRLWALDTYPTACPGMGQSVVSAVVKEAQKGAQGMPGQDAGQLTERLDRLIEHVAALNVQVQRLERLVCTNGGELTVTADASNAATLGNITGKDVRLGERVTLRGDQIPIYLDRMGNNMWIGLQAAQEAASRANAGLEVLRAGQPKWGAGEALEELRLLRFADGSVRLIK